MIKKNFKKIILSFTIIVLIFAIIIASVNLYVVFGTKDRIYDKEKISDISDIDCIIVLGCHVKSDGVPGRMLTDRLDAGIALYKAGVAPKLLMSGDHGRTNYDEVNTMKGYTIEAGISSEDVFMDHAGFSTYESMYRAKEIFCAEKILIVSQEYHLHRAIYLARALGIEAYGVAADYRTYSGQLYRDIREILARDKDYFVALFLPDYPYGGETIPVFGNGNLTNDK